MQDQFQHILETHQNIIWRICKGFLSDEDEQMDLYQEITINIWRKLDSFRKDSKMSTWIYRLAINTSLMYVRKQNRIQEQKDGLAVEMQQTNSKSFENGSDSPETQLMYHCINQLKELDRIIILLVLEGQSYNEISEHLGITSTNVGAKINRIKQKLIALTNEQKHLFI